LTRLRQSSGSSLAARPVDPTRSQNMTVIGRRSAETSGPLGDADLDGEAGAFEGGFPPANAAIASSSRIRSPKAETPMSLRAASVSRGSRSASILLSRKIVSYRPKPRPRSHPPTSWPRPTWLDGIIAQSRERVQRRGRCSRNEGIEGRFGRSAVRKAGKESPLLAKPKPRSAFPRFALVRRTDLKGKQSVEGGQSPERPVMVS
jgi:hypothetical protein